MICIEMKVPTDECQQISFKLTLHWFICMPASVHLHIQFPKTASNAVHSPVISMQSCKDCDRWIISSQEQDVVVH